MRVPANRWRDEPALWALAVLALALAPAASAQQFERGVSVISEEVAGNDTDACRARNRRVEIILTGDLVTAL